MNRRGFLTGLLGTAVAVVTPMPSVAKAVATGGTITGRWSRHQVKMMMYHRVYGGSPRNIGDRLPGWQESELVAGDWSTIEARVLANIDAKRADPYDIYQPTKEGTS